MVSSYTYTKNIKGCERRATKAKSHHLSHETSSLIIQYNLPTPLDPYEDPAVMQLSSWVWQSEILNPVALPLLKAFAQALNWISQLRCTAADLLTNVLPLTSNGRVESPESVIAGAAMPPSAEASETRVAVLTARAAVPVPVVVELEVVEEASVI